MKILPTLALNKSYIAVFLMAVALAAALDWQQSNHFRAEQRLAVAETVDDYRSALEQAILDKVIVTEGLAATVAARPEISQQEFERAASNLIRHVDGVLNVTGAPDLVVQLVYPFRPNRDAIGLDFREHSELMRAVEQSIISRETMFDGPVELTEGRRGFVTRAAVFEFYAGAFENDFWGVVSIIFDAEAVFAAAGLSTQNTEFDFAVQDATGRLIFGSQDVLVQTPVKTEISAPGSDWMLAIAPRDGWTQTSPNRLQTWLIVMGLAVIVLALMRAFKWSLDGKHEAEQRLVEAVNALDDGFSLYDSENRFIMCNQRYKDLYPTSSELMVPGANFADILRRGVETGQYPFAEGREEEWVAERVEAQRNPGGAMETQLSDGRWLRVVERRTPSGNVVGFRVDITELKEALAKSQAVNAAKTEFLNTVSHELRTPLTVMLGYNSFLQNLDALPNHRRLVDSLKDGDTALAESKLDDLKNELRRFTKQIDLSGKQLMELISDILDMAAIEQGTVEIRSEAIDLNASIGCVVEEVLPEAKAKGVALAFEGGPLSVNADAKRLRQILRVLIGNAVKFTDDGSVEVRAHGGAGRVYVEVIDTGAGIAPENLEQIFEQFGQADASSTRHHGGLGLGLPIAKQLAKLQGGKITATSNQGQGSVFTLELEMAKSLQGEAA